jgi:hypothetical protein
MPTYNNFDTSLITVNGFNPEKTFQLLNEYGVVIISNFYNLDVCKKFMEDYIKKCKKILTDMKTAKPGQHKDIICHDSSIWNFRRDPKIKALYSYLYKQGNNLEIFPHVIPSIDGVNMRSPIVAPYHSNTTPDWAHLDQTNGEIYDCIQSQIVFTNSSAGFVCSPKSHLIYKDVMKIMNISETDKSNWCVISGKASEEQEKKIKEKLENIGGVWQAFIPAQAGSLILWSGTVIHSAKIVDKPVFKIPRSNEKEKEKIENNLLSKLEGWRGIIYLCYKPSSKFRFDQKEKRWRAMRNNKTMNHLCTSIWNSYLSNNEEMKTYLDNPTQWKYFNSDLIEEIIKTETQEEIDPEKYHKKIIDILKQNTSA